MYPLFRFCRNLKLLIKLKQCRLLCHLLVDYLFLIGAGIGFIVLIIPLIVPEIPLGISFLIYLICMFLTYLLYPDGLRRIFLLDGYYLLQIYKPQDILPRGELPDNFQIEDFCVKYADNVLSKIKFNTGIDIDEKEKEFVLNTIRKMFSETKQK